MATAESAEGPARQSQQVQGGRDSTVAGRDAMITNNFYGSSEAGVAGRVQRIWGGIPARNPGFKGREELLRTVRDTLAAGDRAVVQALHGMGGIGKTQLVIEYAHRFASDYDLVWWINAERPELISEQFAMIAAELGCAPEGAMVAIVQRTVLAALHGRDRWLLIFDNVKEPEHVASWLPGGNGHVVITSRAYEWEDLAVSVQVNVFTRAESRELLQSRVFGLSDADADEVSEAVGDLPLAVAQAAGYLAYTGIPATEYVQLLADRPVDVMERGKPWSYPRSLAAATRLSFEQMQAEDPVAAEVVAICSFLAPEPIPAEWFPRAADKFTESLGQEVRDQMAWRQVVYRLRGSALVRVDPDGLVMHRLTQAIIRSLLPPENSASNREAAIALVLANLPGDQELPVNWPGWARILPHLLALESAAAGSIALLSAENTAVRYLCRRGDYRAARDLARRLYERGTAQFGNDHVETLRAEMILSVALRGMGNYAAARDILEDNLARRRRVLGEEDPYTLWSANDLAANLHELGEHQAAREMHKDVLSRRRQVLGKDHPDTLTSANNLAVVLRGMGEYQAARELDKETWHQLRRVLGDDHPNTLNSAHNLASDLFALRQYPAARDLYEDVLSRRRLLLGEDHPSTLNTLSGLGRSLHSLGEYQAAQEVLEDVLSRRRQVLGEDHPDTQQSARDLAENLQALEGA